MNESNAGHAVALNNQFTTGDISFDFPPEASRTARVLFLKHVENKSKWALGEEFYYANELYKKNVDGFAAEYNGFRTFREWLNASEEAGGCDMSQASAYQYLRVYETLKVKKSLPEKAYKRLEQIDWNKVDYAKDFITPKNYEDQISELELQTRKDVRKGVAKKQGKPIAVRNAGCKHKNQEYVCRCNDCNWTFIVGDERAVLKSILSKIPRKEGFKIVNSFCSRAGEKGIKNKTEG